MGNKAIHSEWWNVDALVGRDGAIRTPFDHAAFLREWYGGFEHFAPGRIISTTAYTGFDVDVLVAGTLVMEDTLGGWLGLTGGAATQGIQMQSGIGGGEAFLPAANLDIWCECSLRAEDADDIDWYFGLINTDADLWTGEPTEIIAFSGDDGDANIDFQVRDGGAGAAADTGTDLADGIAIRLGFWVKGVTEVEPYINGVAQTAVITNIPTNLTRLTFGMRNGATTANQALSIDWYRTVQLLA